MRSSLIFIGAFLLFGGFSYDSGRAREHFANVTKKCVTTSSSTLVVLGGAEITTIFSSNFAFGSSCSVISPPTTPDSIALRCYVDGVNTAHIVASTAIALGVSVGATTWCVEVRDVSPLFVE